MTEKRDEIATDLEIAMRSFEIELDRHAEGGSRAYHVSAEREFLLDTLGELHARALAIAHGAFIDELRAGRLKYRPHPALTAAVQHANTRPLAGAEALERRRVEADAGPLEAAELAAWLLTSQRRPPQIWSWSNVLDPSTPKENQ